MPVDINTFPFHVTDFLVSERVQLMSAEEIGQFLLLLCQAWQGKKDATLPDDLSFLARAARVAEISPKVLNEFPVVETEWGTRRRNKTLHRLWSSLSEQADVYSERAKAASNARWSGKESSKDATSMLQASGKHSYEDTTSNASAFSDFQKGELINNTINKSNKLITRPHRRASLDTPEVECLSDSERSNLSFAEGLSGKKVFNRLSDLWVAAGRKGMKGLGGRKEEFDTLVGMFGSAHVLSAFELWLADLDPGFDPYYPATEFLKNSERYLSAVRVLLQKKAREAEAEKSFDLPDAETVHLVNKQNEDLLERKVQEVTESELLAAEQQKTIQREDFQI